MSNKWLPYGLIVLAMLLALVVGLTIWRGPSGKALAQGLEAKQETIVQAPVGTALTYQGRLLDNGAAANGTYDFQFELFDELIGGNPVAPAIDVPDFAVAGGLFTIQLDFGEPAFSGEARYLEVRVRPGASVDPHTALDPRQALNPTPYAVQASSVADGAVLGRSIGEPCGQGQVLARNGETWSCASAPVDLTPWQQVDHLVEIGGVVEPLAQADLLTLDINTDWTEFHTCCPDQWLKIPDRSHMEDFFLYCSGTCANLINWYSDIVNENISRQSVSVVLLDGTGSETLRWNGSQCWPSQHTTLLSQDGSALYSAFRMSCDFLQVMVP